MKKSTPEEIKAAKLRKRAESRLKSKVPVSEKVSNPDRKKLIQELEVHQIELEMQNDELRKSQVKLAESRDKFVNLYDFAPVGYLVFDGNGVIREANFTIADMLAVERDILISSRFHYFVKREDQDIFSLHLKKLFEGKNAETCEVTLKGKSAAELPVRLDSIRMRRPRSKSKATCRTAVIDITEQKKTETVLKESEEKYRTLIEAIPDIVYEIDEKGYFTFLSTSVRNLGYEPEELIGKHFNTLLHPDDVKRFSRSLVLEKYSGVRTRERETPKLFDERRSKERMTRNLEVQLVPKSQGCGNRDERRKGLLTSFGKAAAAGHYCDSVHGKSGEFGGTVGIILDITEKIKLQEEMIWAGQLALIGELAAGVAHEINNPICSIINFAQLITDESDRGSRRQVFGKLIMEEGNRIANLTKNLVSLSRDTDGLRISVNTHDLISKALKLIALQLKKDHIIIKDSVPKDLPPLIANPQEIHQVFLNLFQNARYALNERYPGKDRDKILEISSSTVIIDELQYIRILFLDHGIGIPEYILPRVKTLFFTTKPLHIGTGLGLSISENIIRNHGGTITINSMQRKFTEVFIELPAAEERGKI